MNSKPLEKEGEETQRDDHHVIIIRVSSLVPLKKKSIAILMSSKGTIIEQLSSEHGDHCIAH